MRGFFTLTLLLLSFQLAAQPTETVRFGQIIPGDFNIPQFAGEPAVVLFDKGRFDYTDRGYHIFAQFQRHLRILIQDPAEVSRISAELLGPREFHDNKFRIPVELDTYAWYWHFDDRRVEIIDVRAALYTLRSGRIHRRKLAKEEVLVNLQDLREEAIRLPAIEGPCILEIRYSALVGADAIPGWTIQRSIPVEWSEFSVIGTLAMRTLITGGLHPYIYDASYKSTYHRWVFRDVAAFRSEPFMGAERDHRARLDFFTRRENWNDVSKYYRFAHFILYEKYPRRIIRNAAEESVAGLADDPAKARAIIEFVRKNFRWNGSYECMTASISEVFRLRAGASGPLNIVMYTMLREAGLNPTIVLLSTRRNGTVPKDLPSEFHFDHAVVKLTLGGQAYYLDATDSLLGFGELPPAMAGTDGFEITGDGFRWVKLPDIRFIDVKALLQIDDDLTLTGPVTSTSAGLSQSERLNHFSSAAIEGGELAIKTVRPDTQRDTPSPIVRDEFMASIRGKTIQSGDTLFVDPFIFIDHANDWWNTEFRQYPIVLDDAYDQQLSVTLDAGPGYHLITAPAASNLRLGDDAITCTFNVEGGGEQLIISYAFRLNKRTFTAAEYANLRAFYHNLSNLRKTRLALIKIKN